MIKIINGKGDVFEVTNGAYDGIYKRQGFKPLSETKANITKPTVPKKTDEEVFIEGMLEKPISSWSKADVKRFAEIQRIDISGTKNVEEAKARIKECLNA